MSLELLLASYKRFLEKLANIEFWAYIGDPRGAKLSIFQSLSSFRAQNCAKTWRKTSLAARKSG